MPSTVASPLHAMPQAAVSATPEPSARPGVTSGLLKLLGTMKSSRPLSNPPGAAPTTMMPGVTPGSSAILMPQIQSRGMAPVTRPQVPEPASDSSPFALAAIQATPSAQTASPESISFEQLMAGKRPEGGIDQLRQQVLGSYHQETEARLKEFRESMEASLAKTRQMLQERVEQFGVSMQRDLVALRQETHHELEDIKRDVFSAVMSISALNDKLGVADARVREVTTSLTRSLVDRVEQQAQTFDHTMRHLQQRLDEMINARVSGALQRAVQELINVQRGQQQAAAPV
jgi:hypothetical protein